MSIVQNIPFKARLIPTENTFSAPFTGLYDFGIPANDRQTVFPLQANTVYYLDNFSIGGNIAREDYLSAISTMPVMTLYRKQDKSGVYTRSIPIAQFFENKPCTVYVESNKAADELQLSMTGILSQVANLVGIDPVKITVSFSAFAIDERDYNTSFRNSKNFSA